MSEKGITTLGVGIIVVIIVIAAAAGAWVLTRPPTAPAEEWKFAAIFPGSIVDADFNYLGRIAVDNVATTFEIPTAYSERVAVPDSGRVMREYADAGYNIIWAHGAQFNTYVLQVAAEYPNVSFIMESDSPLPENAPTNIWNLHRNFHTGFYALGALAALKTETNKIGYIGGVKLPFSYGEINSIKQAVDRFNPGVDISYAWIGDFNDPTKTRLQAEAMIAEGVDVIMGSVNLGIYGLFDAVRAATENVWVMCKYTDKSAMLPNQMLTSFVYDFSVTVNYAVERIMAGVEGGFTKIEFGEDKACYIVFPILHVTPEIETTIRSVHAEIEAGTVPVENLTEPTF